MWTSVRPWQWAKFFKVINWVQGENNNYRKWPEAGAYTRPLFGSM